MINKPLDEDIAEVVSDLLAQAIEDLDDDEKQYARGKIVRVIKLVEAWRRHNKTELDS